MGIEFVADLELKLSRGYPNFIYIYIYISFQISKAIRYFWLIDRNFFRYRFSRICQFSSGKLIAFKVTLLSRCNRIPEAAGRRGSINREIRAVASGRAPIIGRDNEDQR